MIVFQDKDFFLLLILLLLPLGLLISTIYWKRKIYKQFGDALLASYLTKPYSSFKFYAKFFIVFLSFILLIIAVSNPIVLIKNGINNLQDSKADIVIALDLSTSMLAKDIGPSRLENAKYLISNIISNSSGNRIGLVVFAGKAFLEMPLTTDFEAIITSLTYLIPANMPVQGTNIEDALKISQNALNSYQNRPKAVVLITDGESHDNNIVKLAQKYRKQNIKLFTVGVGTKNGSFLQEGKNGELKKDANGKLVVSKLNESLLINLAEVTNGNFFMLKTKSNNEAKNILKLSNTYIKEVNNVNSSGTNESFYQYFLSLALLLLVIEIFIPETKKPIYENN